jgi:hypothetical protein
VTRSSNDTPWHIAIIHLQPQGPVPTAEIQSAAQQLPGAAVGCCGTWWHAMRWRWAPNMERGLEGATTPSGAVDPPPAAAQWRLGSRLSANLSAEADAVSPSRQPPSQATAP